MRLTIVNVHLYNLCQVEKQTNMMFCDVVTFIMDSPKLIKVSWASETHCRSAKLDFD